MSRLSRRDFCGAVAAFAATGAKSLWSLPASLVPDIATMDHERILHAANEYLPESPITITSYSSPRSAGGPHDYFSEADYWWPDPKNPSGPYIRRDGMSNPDNFTAHRHALIRLSLQVPALAAAWKITGDKKYAAHATLHLRAWFLDPKTSMNPNLEYAQAIHGVTRGRGTGIIDTLHLVEVARAIPFIETSGALFRDEAAGVRRWFADYLNWMTTSKNGIEEREAKNNHGTCWVLQVAEFASYTGNQELMTFCRDRFKRVLVPNQIGADGRLPLELARTKPYGYCLFDLEALTTASQVLSTRDENLFAYQLRDGRSLARAVEFMVPFIENKNSWPFPHDVEYWDDWPVRQPTLLFSGIALSKPEYIRLWRKLNPDSKVEEIIRNNPIRQPLLWI